MVKEIYNEYGLIPSDFEGLEDDDWYLMAELLEEQLTNLFNNKQDDKQYVITGILGLWDGKYKCYSEKVFTSLKDAIDECRQGVDDIIIYEEKYGKLFVDGLHHDGRNTYEIKELSKKGIKMKENGYNRDITEVKGATKNVRFVKSYW